MPEGTSAPLSQRIDSLRANYGHGDVTTERINRLPDWAANYIDELEAALLRAIDRVASTYGGSS